MTRPVRAVLSIRRFADAPRRVFSPRVQGERTSGVQAVYSSLFGISGHAFSNSSKFLECRAGIIRSLGEKTRETPVAEIPLTVPLADGRSVAEVLRNSFLRVQRRSLEPLKVETILEDHADMEDYRQARRDSFEQWNSQ